MKNITGFQTYPIIEIYLQRPLRSVSVKTDLRPLCSSVEDQGNLGSCTGNALVGAIEVLENIEKASFVDLSRLFVYYNERAMEGTIQARRGCRHQGWRSRPW